MDSTAWNRRYAEGQLLWSGRPNRFLEQEVGQQPPGRAIDLACGQGRNAVWLAERGWCVTGVDFSTVGLERARALAGERGVEVEWIEADLRDYQPEHRSFDLVVVFYLQVPPEERTPIVRAAAEGLAPEGTFLLVGHHADNVEHGYGGPQNPAVLYTAEEIAADLAATGLRIERAHTARRAVETAESEQIALDALVRARR